MIRLPNTQSTASNIRCQVPRDTNDQFSMQVEGEGRGFRPHAWANESNRPAFVLRTSKPSPASSWARWIRPSWRARPCRLTTGMGCPWMPRGRWPTASLPAFRRGPSRPCRQPFCVDHCRQPLVPQLDRIARVRYPCHLAGGSAADQSFSLSRASMNFLGMRVRSAAGNACRISQARSSVS